MSGVRCNAQRTHGSEHIRIDVANAVRALQECCERTAPAVITLGHWQRRYAKLNAQPADGQAVRVCVRKGSVLSRYPVVLGGACALSPAAQLSNPPKDILVQMFALQVPGQLGERLVEPAWRITEADSQPDRRFTLAEMAIAGAAQRSDAALKERCYAVLGRAYPTWREALAEDWMAGEARLLSEPPAVLDGGCSADEALAHALDYQVLWAQACEGVLGALPRLNLAHAFDYIEAMLARDLKPRPGDVHRLFEAGVRLDAPAPTHWGGKTLAQRLSRVTRGAGVDVARHWAYVLLAQSVRPDTSSAPSAHPVPRL